MEENINRLIEREADVSSRIIELEEEFLNVLWGASIDDMQVILRAVPAERIRLSSMVAFIGEIVDRSGIGSICPELLRLLVDYKPDLITEHFPDGGLLLHVACADEDVPVEFVQFLIEKNRKGLFVRDEHGMLPLHVACRYGCSFDIVQLLLEGYPDAAFETDRDGELPLHSFCSCAQASLVTLELLLSYNPGATRVHARAGIPLHIALADADEWGGKCAFTETIMALLNSYPQSAEVMNEDGRIALHIACMWDVPSEIVGQLLAFYPQGGSFKDAAGMIPLHFLLRYWEASKEVVQLLLNNFPHGSRTKDNDGLFPLHCACARPTPFEVIELLVDANPAAVSERDETGRLPLHHACLSGRPPETVELLIDSYQGADEDHRGLNVADSEGNLPIHCTCRFRYYLTGSLQLMLRRYPASAKAFNNKGRLPLHEACDPGFRANKTVLPLVEADLFTVVQGTRDGKGLTPLQLAWNSFQNSHLYLDEIYDRIVDLIEKQNEAVPIIKETFEAVAETQLGLPDLVTANIWSFAKPWYPPLDANESET